MAQNNGQPSKLDLRVAPKGLAILAMIGPSMVWAAEYIGSGEVIVATRTGAVLARPSCGLWSSECS